MKAEEARRIATKTNDRSNNSNYVDLLNEIKKESDAGALFLNTDIIARDAVIKRLQADGYEVKIVFDQRDGDYTQIKW